MTEPAAPASPTRAGWVPRVPADYYERIYAVERAHPWHRGMRSISAALVGERLKAGGRVLDAGCGTGGFLQWLLARGPFTRAAGVDISREAITLARGRVPEGEFEVASLSAVPLPNGAFDLIVCNDVLQHVPEQEVNRSVSELARVLAPGGALLLRTTGARRVRREGVDWRAYDRPTIAAHLQRAGLHCERLTYANLVGSLWAVARGRRPRAPNAWRDGIPEAGGRIQGRVMVQALELEAAYLARPGASLPYGHTLMALATKR